MADVDIASNSSPLVIAATTAKDGARSNIVATVSGGGTPPVVVSYINYGWCTNHNTNETWITAGAPGPAPLGHVILAGSQSYTVAP